MIIQPNTNIIIRTEEEYQVFCEIGDKEGIQWWKGGWYKLSDRDSAEILRDWGAIYIDKDRKATRIYMSPKGKTLSQKIVRDLADSGKDLVLLCGHYEGVDQRVIDLFIDEEISIGDYVLTGGELPAMVLSDAVCRYIDGVLSAESLVNESFSDNLLEYPQYTRPQVFMGLEVPEVLLSGDHKKVDEWRRQKSLEITKKLRPDLIKGE